MIGCLIIHGYTGGPYEVEPLREYLVEQTDWNIVVPTLTGHGEQLDLKDVSYEVWLEDATRALEELKQACNKVYVIGFSMGGMIAAYLAATIEVDKLVLLATARKYLSFKHLSQYVAEVIGDSFKGKLEENEIYRHYKSKFGTVPLSANIEFMKLVNKTKDYLEEITTPVFIAQGKQDGMVPYQVAYALEEEIGSEDKEIVFFEESSHLICLGHDKDVLNQMVLGFLKKDT
ncbi:MAG TPA: alpha/beta fold hydrolase [Candidatus Pseudogracilibacillus intestinigallinarum]|uniref:Alpha/beta fold hydrolase n=1 Tax=Candidatus Pseudogracilibacillus intestinigallinarum TaxID=2838742 RepID=A0A9D1TJU0_9BACI|nr:alpha/beta fold hydrolase [Candidatus Pseudogracilibacillus intestinigallinarum]